MKRYYPLPPPPLPTDILCSQCSIACPWRSQENGTKNAICEDCLLHRNSNFGHYCIYFCADRKQYKLDLSNALTGILNVHRVTKQTAKEKALLHQCACQRFVPSVQQCVTAGNDKNMARNTTGDQCGSETIVFIV